LWYYLFMAFTLEWNNLPPEMRVGSSGDEHVTLYRGFNPAVEDPSKGFVSAAYDAEAAEVIYDAMRAVRNGNIARLAGYLSAHTTPGGWRDRGLTPFVSVTPDKSIAERYARGQGEQVATMVLEARQLVLDAWFAYEGLVIGKIDPDQIVTVEDAPDESATTGLGYSVYGASDVFTAGEFTLSREK
jgi:hypothetical protein